MSKANNGGPAFPDWNNGYATKSGMTLRDYFAAHAPEKPQSWFKPQMNRERPAARWVSKDGSREYPSAEAAAQECRHAYRNANELAGLAWDDEYMELQCILWPYAWADAMLKVREVAPQESNT